MLENAGCADSERINSLRIDCVNALKSAMWNVSKVAHEKRRHEALIDGILRAFPDAQTRGFTKAINEYHFDPEDAEDVIEWRYRPDAFLIDELEGVVLVFD